MNLTSMRHLLLPVVIIITAALMAACSGDSSPRQEPSRGSDAKGWQWEHDLSGNNAATEDQTIAMKLTPVASSPLVKAGLFLKRNLFKSTDEAGLSTKRIPFRFKRAGRHSYCLENDDPVFSSFSLLDGSGATLLSVKPGECKEIDVQAAPYTAVVDYNASNLSQNGSLAFIGREKQARLVQIAATSANKGSSVAATTATAWLALLDERGNVMTLSANTPINNHDNFFWVSQQLSAKGGAVSLDDLVQFTPNTYAKGFYNMATRSRGALGGFVPVFCTKSCPPSDSGYGQCDIRMEKGLVQSPLYTYSSENRTTPPIMLFALSDLGNYSFSMAGYDLYGQVGGGYLPLAMMPDSTACYASGSASSKFTVWFRYFDDGTKIPDLQDGEVALFSGVNYTGKAWIFARDIPDFGVIQGLAGISSVKTGPNMKISIYSTVDRNSSNGWYTGGSTADLTKTSIGTSATALYRSTDVTKLTLSSRSCRYCDLSGIQIPNGLQINPGSQNGYLDFTGANLSNANFSNATIERVLFTDALMTGVVIQDTVNKLPTMVDVDFTNAILDHAIIQSSTQSSRMQMYNISLQGASLKGSRLEYLSISFKTLSGSDFSGATINNVGIDCSNGTDCINKRQPKINLNNARISSNGSGADYFVIDLMHKHTLSLSQHMTMQGTLFYDPFDFYGLYDDLSSAANFDFSGARFPVGMDFSRIRNACADMTNLTGCLNLSGATMAKSNFKGANLTGANLSMLNLNGYDLSATTLNWTNLSGTNISNSILYGTQLNNANLDGAKLCNAKMSGDGQLSASFNKAFLRNALLSNAQLTGVNFANASIYAHGSPILMTSYPD